MSGDFMNFAVLDLLFSSMYALVGNILFLYDVPRFNGLFNSVLTIVDASLGNYNFYWFDEINDPTM